MEFLESEVKLFIRWKLSKGFESTVTQYLGHTGPPVEKESVQKPDIEGPTWCNNFFLKTRLSGALQWVVLVVLLTYFDFSCRKE